jgi:serine/threonine protein kinase
VEVKHGDIKSNNVKFNVHSGNYMLLDFGLAVMSDEQRRTSLRHAGAIEFMAPEQNSGEMLFETDVYSFGVILYELLAGVVPFPLMDKGETSRNAVMVSHLETPIPDVLALRRKNLPASWSDDKRAREMQVPGWLLNIVTKCLEKRPENRFKNGIELHEAIVQNSTSPKDNYAYNATEVAVLQSENARLEGVLLQYQQAAAKPGAPGVAGFQNVISANETSATKRKYRSTANGSGQSAYGGLKPVVMGLMILLACLGLFAGFSMYNGRSSANVVIDTAAIRIEKERLRDSINALERLNAKRVQDSIDNARRYNAIKQRIAQVSEEEQREQDKRDEDFNKEEKKRRKKFFEIKFEKRN